MAPLSARSVWPAVSVHTEEANQSGYVVYPAGPVARGTRDVHG